MVTFLGAAAFILFVFLALYAANEADKKLNNAIKTTEKMKERLDVMEMRLNAIFESTEEKEEKKKGFTVQDILDSYKGSDFMYMGDNVTGHD